LKTEVRVEEEYGAKSAGQFGLKQLKPKSIRNSQGFEDDNIYLSKGSPRPVEPLKMKKLKSPVRLSKLEASSKRKSLAKERYF
jgi:hypothetical protein